MSRTEEALLSAITEDLGKQETDANDVARLLEAKLALERAAWKRSHAQAQVIRAASFAFLFLILLGTIVAFYLASTRVVERRNVAPAESTQPNGANPSR